MSEQEEKALGKFEGKSPGELFKMLRTDDSLTLDDIGEIRCLVFPEGTDMLDVEDESVDKMLTALARARERAELRLAEIARVAQEAQVAQLEVNRDKAKSYLTEQKIPLTGISEDVLDEIWRSLDAQQDEALVPEEEHAQIISIDEEINALVTPSGEIIAFIDAPEFDTDKKDILEYVGRTLTAKSARQTGLEAEKQAWVDKINRIYDPQINKQRRAVNAVVRMFTPLAKAYLDEIIEKAKEQCVKKLPKSVKVGLLMLQYTATRDSTDAVDMDKAVAYCRKQGWIEAIKETVLVSKIPAPEKGKLTKDISNETGIVFKPGGEQTFSMK